MSAISREILSGPIIPSPAADAVWYHFENGSKDTRYTIEVRTTTGSGIGDLIGYVFYNNDPAEGALITIKNDDGILSCAVSRNDGSYILGYKPTNNLKVRTLDPRR